MIDFGLDVESYRPQGWRLGNCGGRAALTKDENVVYPYFCPNENVDCDQEREKYWDEDRGIDDEEPAPNRDLVSGGSLET